MEGVLSTITLLKIWIKNTRKLYQLAAGRDVEKKSEIKILVASPKQMESQSIANTGHTRNLGFSFQPSKF